MDQAGAADGLFEGGADLRVERLQGLVQGLNGDAGRGEVEAVEPMGQLPNALRALMAHLLADGPHLLEGGLHVELGAGQHVAQVPRKGPAQVDTGNHLNSLRTPGPESRDVHHADIRGTAIQKHNEWTDPGLCPQ